MVIVIPQILFLKFVPSISTSDRYLSSNYFPNCLWIFFEVIVIDPLLFMMYMLIFLTYDFTLLKQLFQDFVLLQNITVLKNLNTLILSSVSIYLRKFDISLAMAIDALP